MKILFVIHNFLPRYIGGTELYTFYLAKELQKKGHEVKLFFRDYRSDYEFEREGMYDNLPYISVSCPSRTYFSYASKRNAKKIAHSFSNLLKKFQPDIIHIQHLVGLAVDIVEIAKRRKIPIVFTLHDYWLICNQIRMWNQNKKICHYAKQFNCGLCNAREGLLPFYSLSSKDTMMLGELVKRPLKFIFNFFILLVNVGYYWFGFRKLRSKYIFDAVDLFISPSRFLRNMMIEHGLPERKILFSDNGIIKEKNISLGDAVKNSLVFAYIGGISDEKGIPVLIDAFNNINDAQLEIYGAGAKTYQNRIKNSKIKLYGVVSGQAKNNMLARIDVLVVPSVWFENSPLTIHEAFMFGKPVITSNIGGMAELVQDGVNGLHFKVGDIDDLRNKIQFLIAHPEDISKMSAQTPHIKSIEENAIELENIYKARLLKT